MDLAQFHGTTFGFCAFLKFSQFLFPDVQLFRPQCHWRNLISRNMHLVHQNWHCISFTHGAWGQEKPTHPTRNVLWIIRLPYYLTHLWSVLCHNFTNSNKHIDEVLHSSLGLLSNINKRQYRLQSSLIKGEAYCMHCSI
jgi:hypothetical protein